MKRFIVLTLALLITACSDVDNSEQPAPLTEYVPSVSISVAANANYSPAASLFSRVEPLVINQRIYAIDSEGVISAFDQSTLKPLWQRKTDKVQPSVLGGSATTLLVATHDGEVIAVNANDGKLLWNVRVSSEVLARPAISDGIAIIKAVDGQLTALDTRTGKQLWFYKKEVPALSVRGNSSPLIVDNKIITGLDNGKLIIVDLRTGGLFWEKTISIPRGRSETDRLVDIDADVILQDNMLYIAGYQGRVVAIDLRNGEFIWSKNMSVIENMSLENDRLYLTDVRSQIWALDTATGATVWKQSAFTARKLTTPVVKNDYIYLGDYQGYLHVIAKADGRQLGRQQIDEDGINVAPIINKAGIVIYTKNAKIYQVTVDKKPG